MAVSTYTKAGAKATTPAKLDKNVFGVEVKNHELLKQAYLAYLANGRENFAVTKKRGEVRGGGAKPWRQKGTGRARFGSSRNPIWRGGGIAFGPTGNENYSHKMNVKTKRVALRQALSLASTENRIKVIEDVNFADGKLKPIANLLKKLEAERKTLLVVDLKNDMSLRATKNLKEVKVVQAKYLQVFDILNCENIVVTKKALDIVHEWLGDTPRTSVRNSKEALSE
jgi:large subunit ribosomal protein L4